MMNGTSTMEINFIQAQAISQEVDQEKIRQQTWAWSEVTESDFSLYTFLDILYFSDILGISTNEVRAINALCTGKGHYEYTGTFLGDDTDDILNFIQ